MFLTWLGYPVPSKYVRHDTSNQLLASLGTGYLMLEYIDAKQGQMLSNTWTERRAQLRLRQNLFRDLCRVLVDMAQVPLRTLEIQELENEGILVDIPRNFTYSTADSYVTGILVIHDCRLRCQPNAISNVEDCLYQMSALTTMRALCPLFLRRDLQRGPFIFALTDMHQSNLFVDENWHITKIIDLECACSRPVELLHPPQWLTDQPVDMMDAAQYDSIRREFMDILVEVEREDSAISLGFRLSSIMNDGWDTGTFWYSLALKSLSGLCRLFYDHIQPRLALGHEDDEEFYRIVHQYWIRDAKLFIYGKLRDKNNYDSRLQEEFGSRENIERRMSVAITSVRLSRHFNAYC
jgi:Phosphotransferase enzyme family